MFFAGPQQVIIKADSYDGKDFHWLFCLTDGSKHKDI